LIAVNNANNNNDNNNIGNPAGIVVLDHDDHAHRRTDAIWMQQLAKETNLPVTAFLVPRRYILYFCVV
jgi:predicted PhzF superfamily epimerase YddE/YHI9